MKTDKTPIVAVEGIIGAGKTTVCQRLTDCLPLLYVEEPTEENPWLERFYKDKSKWALHMQMWLIGRRARTIIQAYDLVRQNGAYKGILVDRSMLGDRVFALMHRREGNIAKELWPIYDDFFQNMTIVVPPPEVMIYLDVTPSLALEGVKNRARAAEQDGVTLEYLQSLKGEYRKMIADVCNKSDVDANGEPNPWSWTMRTRVHKCNGHPDSEGVKAIAEVVSMSLGL